MNMRYIKCAIILVLIVALQIDANTLFSREFVGKEELSLIDSCIPVKALSSLAGHF